MIIAAKNIGTRTKYNNKSVKCATISSIIFFILLPFITELNDKVNGNILTYNESEDAYYIQHGADSVPKKLGSNLKLIGTITGDGTVSCAEISGYDKLNENNFIVVITSIQVTASYHRGGTGTGDSNTGTATITKTYDKSTGILTVSGLSYTLMAGNSANYGQAVLVGTANVYVN